jgi:hypothetical protein
MCGRIVGGGNMGIALKRKDTLSIMFCTAKGEVFDSDAAIILRKLKIDPVASCKGKQAGDFVKVHPKILLVVFRDKIPYSFDQITYIFKKVRSYCDRNKISEAAMPLISLIRDGNAKDLLYMTAQKIFETCETRVII